MTRGVCLKCIVCCHQVLLDQPQQVLSQNKNAPYRNLNEKMPTSVCCTHWGNSHSDYLPFLLSGWHMLVRRQNYVFYLYVLLFFFQLFLILKGKFLTYKIQSTKSLIWFIFQLKVDLHNFYFTYLLCWRQLVHC